MNDAKHTKGPWIHSKHGFNVLTADEMHSICAVHAPNPGHTSEKDVQEHLANARLIAAAPDLLEACEASLWAVNAAECLGEKEGIGKDTTKYPERIKLDTIVESVRAAIRKAEGK